QCFGIFALMGVAELSPSVPSRRRGFKRLDEVGRRLHFSLIDVEVEPHLNRLASLESRRLAIALAQGNERRSTHRGDGASIRVSIKCHLDGRAHFAKYGLG